MDEFNRDLIIKISKEISEKEGFLENDILLLIDYYLNLNLFDKEKLLMFDICNFIDRNLSQELSNIMEKFSISTGCFIFGNNINNSLFLKQSLTFTCDFV